jgi:hypothetical protein
MNNAVVTCGFTMFSKVKACHGCTLPGLPFHASFAQGPLGQHTKRLRATRDGKGINIRPRYTAKPSFDRIQFYCAIEQSGRSRR